MRSISIKKVNWGIIAKVLGFLLIIEGVMMFTGIPFSIYYCGFECLSLLYSGLITIAAGGLMYLLNRKRNDSQLGKREGYLIVSLAWVIISVFGTLPFLISGSISNFTDAFFETMSGFTTTGATILNDIEAQPKGILFWRSMTHWIGGMGIIVLSLAILPILGIGGMQLFVAEVPGPTKDKLHPRIKETAKRLWGIYVLLTFVQTILMMFGGMNLFDALCHAFATMATGGFSTQNASVANYSPYIQYVIIIFMILAGTNFALHYFSLSGKIKKVFRDEEYRVYLLTILLSTIVIALGLIFMTDRAVEKSFRDALFQVVSIITTTGFVTDDYLLWPVSLWMIIFLLMFVGGSAGSTGGGVKVVRQLLLFKNTRLELKRIIHPHAFLPVRLNGRVISEEIISKVMAFFLIYMMIFGLGVLVMSLTGLNYESSIGSVIASLGNIGPGIGAVGPVLNYAEITVFGKWFLSFLMLLGRLELFTILILLSPTFWKK